MRELSATLLAAQKQAAATPYVKVEARNMITGVVRADWSRYYAGSEPSGPHALTLPSDGSLVRARVTPVADARKLYLQRVNNPGPASDYSQWVYTGHYNVLAVAAASLVAEVSICWARSNREIRRIVSTDNGASWGSPEVIGYSATTSVYGLAAAYTPGGALALFFADQSSLCVIQRISGQWQAATAWDKTTGDLSGVACAYDGDWNLLLTGQDTAGNYKLWSLVHGDGGEVAAGTWSALNEIASAPSGGNYEYCQPFLDNPDVCRGFFTERFSGTEAYQRPFWSHTAVGSVFADSLWREPVPFNFEAEYGLALAHHGNAAWLSCPDGVWRADLTPRSIDLTADVIALRQEVGADSGSLTVELRNDEGRYAAPGTGTLEILQTGCQLEFAPGYVTAIGSECSSGQSYTLEAFEHIVSGGQATLVLYARCSLAAIGSWRARHQFRWNKNAAANSAGDILAFMLARAGLGLEAVSPSAVITGYCPDFSVNPGNDGLQVMRKLLSFVPDVLFTEGAVAYLVNPQVADSPVYNYGVDHVVLEGRYRVGAWGLNWVQIEGYDEIGSHVILAESLAWDEVGRMYDRSRQVADRNLGTVAAAQQRGQAYLRQAELDSVGGSITVPVNCG